MKVLITGITGRIGANVAAELLKQGHEIRGLVWARHDRVDKLEGMDIELIYGTITEMQDAVKAVAGVDAVYHLGAAYQAGGPFTEEEYFETNVKGTFNMIESARRQGNLQHFIYASSDAVYGGFGTHRRPTGGAIIQEDTTPRPVQYGWYSLSKHLGEEICSGYVRTYDFPVTSLRFAWVHAGPEILKQEYFYLSSLRAVYPELESLWDGEERLVLLRGQDGRPFKMHMVDIRDIVQGLVATLGNTGAIGEVLHLAGPKPFTFDDVIPYLARKLEIPMIEATASPPNHYELDISKARRLIGFDPQYDILRMIDDAIDFEQGADLGIVPNA